MTAYTEDDEEITLEELHKRAYNSVDKSDNFNYDDNEQQNEKEDTYFNLALYRKYRGR